MDDVRKALSEASLSKPFLRATANLKNNKYDASSPTYLQVRPVEVHLMTHNSWVLGLAFLPIWFAAHLKLLLVISLGVWACIKGITLMVSPLN